MIQKRWKEVESKTLFTGTGENIDNACVMQMVSYVAGEPWSDHPECACPILTNFAINLNDRFNDEHRQRLKPLIPVLVGTRSTDAVQIQRKRLLMFRNVTVVYPMILEVIKMPELAEKLRAFGNNAPDMVLVSALLQENKEAIWKNADTYAYASAYADTYAYAYAYVDAYASASAYAYAYVDASASAYASAYVDAYASAYVDAYALRGRIAIAAIESLRLGCEIKAEVEAPANA